jgi:hypothetical protein
VARTYVAPPPSPVVANPLVAIVWTQAGTRLAIIWARVGIEIVAVPAIRPDTLESAASDV